jgi:regulator of sirC expression with transglutaminase-like and TPR domain
MMEKLMVALIDICVKNNNTQALKENLQNFRNLYQHSSMPLLESVFKYLMKANSKIIQEIEQKEGVEKVAQLLSDDTQTH